MDPEQFEALVAAALDPLHDDCFDYAARLRAAGFGPEGFVARQGTFAGLPAVLAEEELAGVDLILADLGVSSMQLDDPGRGFSMKFDGPLDMRMNPARGQSAAALLQKMMMAMLPASQYQNIHPPNQFKKWLNLIARKNC